MKKTRSLHRLIPMLLAALMLAFSLSFAIAESAPDAEVTAAPTPKPTLFQTIGKNIGFILTAFAISAGIALAAYLVQRFLLKGRIRKLDRTRKITYTALFSSMAGVLMLLEFPLFFAPFFYKLDVSEIPVMICAFFMGPVYGVIAEFIKVVIHAILKGTTTAFVGDFANFIVGCSFVLPASIIYHYNPSRKSALIGLIAGTLCMTVFGSAFNAFYLIPKFAELFMPMEQIIAFGTAVNKHITSVGSLVIWAVVPFNILKGIIISLVTFFIYKPISQAMKMEHRKKVL
ncbi:MAG: ECF transporter S component [Clostridia bacterium]|nr:ECF transporter S component [Clostridia bacterium]